MHTDLWMSTVKLNIEQPPIHCTIQPMIKCEQCMNTQGHGGIRPQDTTGRDHTQGNMDSLS